MADAAEVRVFPDADALARAAGEMVATAAIEAVAARGHCDLALAGGSTPRRLYTLLAEDPELAAAMPWPKLHLFWGDERCVPPDHDESNYRMVREALLAKAPVPRRQVYRMRAEDADPAAAAADYERLLRAHFGGPPRFDVALLGIGEDGHTASLFPGADALAERARLAVAIRAPSGQARITLTLPALNGAALILFMASGGDKARAVADALRSPRQDAVPAGRVQPDSGRLVWMLDAPAGALLGAAPR